MEKTHWKKVVSDPNYIGEADFQEGEEKILTIDHVVKSEKIATKDGSSDKPVLYWREKEYKPMILNVAKAKNIAKVAGSDYFEDWAGVKVQLYIEHGIRAFGDVVNAVRVRPYKPKVSTIEFKCEADGCGKVIGPAHGMSPEQLVQYTTKKYGKKLCAACAEKFAAGTK